MKLLEVKRRLIIELDFFDLMKYEHALKLISSPNEGTEQLIKEIESILDQARDE